MTENEALLSALKKVKEQKENFGFMDRFNVDENWEVMKALEEIQQYRAIGTIEEFKALKEKVEPKKPILNNPKINEFYIKEAKLCPVCHSYINDCSGDYCRDCGQRIDFGKEE